MYTNQPPRKKPSLLQLSKHRRLPRFPLIGMAECAALLLARGGDCFDKINKIVRNVVAFRCLLNVAIPIQGYV